MQSWPGAWQVERELLKISQEALRNAVEHGHANRIHVEVVYSDASSHLRIIDDGCGFNVNESAPPNQAHWGLVGMDERASAVGGRLSIVSGPGTGTRVEVTVPRAAAA